MQSCNPAQIGWSTYAFSSRCLLKCTASNIMWAAQRHSLAAPNAFESQSSTVPQSPAQPCRRQGFQFTYSARAPSAAVHGAFNSIQSNQAPLVPAINLPISIACLILRSAHGPWTPGAPCGFCGFCAPGEILQDGLRELGDPGADVVTLRTRSLRPRPRRRCHQDLSCPCRFHRICSIPSQSVRS